MMIKQLSLLLALASAPAVSAIELTPDNWDAETSGKTIFVKFYAPWVSKRRAYDCIGDYLSAIFLVGVIAF